MIIMEEEHCASNNVEGDSEPHATYIHRDATLPGVLRSLFVDIVVPDPAASSTLLHRIRASIEKNVPRLPAASKTTAHDILLWTRRGGPLRALLVISIGSVGVLATTGLLIFMVFLLAATFNAVVISLLFSLAAAGGVLALFFTSVAAIYIGALMTAAFVISTATISTIVAVLVVSGWIGFIWTVWFAMRESVHIAKHTLATSGSVFSALRGRVHPEVADISVEQTSS